MSGWQLVGCVALAMMGVTTFGVIAEDIGWIGGTCVVVITAIVVVSAMMLDGWQPI